MTRDERVKEIRKAIKLLGWTAVFARVKSVEDKAIVDELSKEFLASSKASEDRVLEKHKIKF